MTISIRGLLKENTMSIAAQPLTTENPALSPWWLRTVLIVMTLGFAGLIVITSLAYRNTSINIRPTALFNAR